MDINKETWKLLIGSPKCYIRSIEQSISAVAGNVTVAFLDSEDEYGTTYRCHYVFTTHFH